MSGKVNLLFVNAGAKSHQTPERKCATWLDLAGVKLRQLVGLGLSIGPHGGVPLQSNEAVRGSGQTGERYLFFKLYPIDGCV